MRILLNVLCVFVVCFFTVSSVYADEILLKEFDRSFEVFNFKEGKLIKLDPKKMNMEKTDLLFDLPQGLGTNNKKLFKIFTGNAGIVDMGKQSIDKVLEAPEGEYLLALGSKMIKEGHTYCVKTSDGEHYGKIEILKFENTGKDSFIKFLWKFQPKKNTRTFN